MPRNHGRNPNRPTPLRAPRASRCARRPRDDGVATRHATRVSPVSPCSTLEPAEFKNALSYNYRDTHSIQDSHMFILIDCWLTHSISDTRLSRRCMSHTLTHSTQTKSNGLHHTASRPHRRIATPSHIMLNHRRALPPLSPPPPSLYSRVDLPSPRGRPRRRAHPAAALTAAAPSPRSTSRYA